MDADFFIISNKIFQDLSFLKSLNQFTLEYLVSVYKSINDEPNSI